MRSENALNYEMEFEHQNFHHADGWPCRGHRTVRSCRNELFGASAVRFYYCADDRSIGRSGLEQHVHSADRLESQCTKLTHQGANHMHINENDLIPIGIIGMLWGIIALFVGIGLITDAVKKNSQRRAAQRRDPVGYYPKASTGPGVGCIVSAIVTLGSSIDVAGGHASTLGAIIEGIGAVATLASAMTHAITAGESTPQQ